MKSNRQKRAVIVLLQSALESQFECYTWATMIDDLDLTPEEKQWAKDTTWPAAHSAERLEDTP